MIGYIIIGCSVLIIIFIWVRDITSKIKAELKIKDMEIARLKGHIQALTQEIDFHLHQGDELANSYFSTCKELRDAKSSPYNYKYDVWMGK